MSWFWSSLALVGVALFSVAFYAGYALTRFVAEARQAEDGNG